MIEPNETLDKYGYPENVLREYDRWIVMMRPKQITLGALVLVCKDNADRLPNVSVEAWAELPIVTADIEATLADLFQFDKINYVALMMVDKHVHWHVIPRYAKEREMVGVTFKDPGWPKHPDFENVAELSGAEFATVRKKIRSEWVDLSGTTGTNLSTSG